MSESESPGRSASESSGQSESESPGQSGSESSGPSDAADTSAQSDAAEHRDALPEDLDVSVYVGPYQFPDNSRRRIPGLLYLIIAAGCVLLYVLANDTWAFVNEGWLWAAVALTVTSVICFTSGWRMTVKEVDALVSAQQALGFPVGHASAQQVWRGLRSRPTWRVLCYSTEEPPQRRGLVLVDAVDGRVVEQLVEANPETWG